MYSIDKGGGLGDTVYKKKYISSGIAYKLSIQKAWLIYEEEKIFYNPFFSRALEDIIFNSFITRIKKGIRNVSYFLRFAHSYSDQQDAEDNFPDYVNNSEVEIKGIEQITFLCLFYVYILYKNDHIQFESEIDGVRSEYKITLFGEDFIKINVMGRNETKYINYHKDIFKMLILFEDELYNKLQYFNGDLNLFNKFAYINLQFIFRTVNHGKILNIIKDIYLEKYKSNIDDKSLKKILSEKKYEEFIINVINNFDALYKTNYISKLPLLNELSELSDMKKKNFCNNFFGLGKGYFGEYIPTWGQNVKVQDKEDKKYYIMFRGMVDENILSSGEYYINNKFIVSISPEYIDKVIEKFIETNDINALNQIKNSDFADKKIIIKYNDNGNINIDWFKEQMTNNGFIKFYDYLEFLCNCINKKKEDAEIKMQIKYLKYKYKYLQLKNKI